MYGHESAGGALHIKAALCSACLSLPYLPPDWCFFAGRWIGYSCLYGSVTGAAAFGVATVVALLK